MIQRSPNRRLTIAIDGPSGAGKSTVAKRVADALGYTYIDTGAMYRAVALAANRQGVSLDNVEAMAHLSETIEINFHLSPQGQRVIVNGLDATEMIRSPEITRLSSPVSAIPGVRRNMVVQQQRMGAGGGVVMEGRDIGSVVFPNAEVKVFLTASPRERARRRCNQLSREGYKIRLDQILKEQAERDERDSSRSDSPLRQMPDAIYINSDHLTVDGVVELILKRCAEVTDSSP